MDRAILAGITRVSNASLCESSENIDTGREEYDLKLRIKEVRLMFQNMIEGWFKVYDFIKALLEGDTEAMNYYMNKVALATFSNFDIGSGTSETIEPERFYHGFVLGLMVDCLTDIQLPQTVRVGLGAMM